MYESFKSYIFFHAIKENLIINSNNAKIYTLILLGNLVMSYRDDCLEWKKEVPQSSLDDISDDEKRELEEEAIEQSKQGSY